MAAQPKGPLDLTYPDDGQPGGDGAGSSNPNGQATAANSAPVVLASDVPVQVVGNTAESTADSGNPVKMGAIYAATPPTYTTGQRSALVTDSRGNLKVALFGNNTSGNSVDITNPTDANSTTAWSALGVKNKPYVFTGVWDFARMSNIVRTVATAAAGNTALWTPTTGKKFRLMRYRIEVTANASLAAAGVLTIKLQDATTDTQVQHQLFLPATAGTTMAGSYGTSWMDLGHGLLSALANNALNLNLSAALATGSARIVVAGMEE